MEYNHLDWKSYLVGQSYDGAASMQGKYNGLQTKIKEVNPQAIFVWCDAHRLDLIITSAVGSCAKAVDLFGNMEKLFTFISCSKKRISMYREKQKKLYPNARIRALKKVETTRWMSQAYALTTVLETLDSILETLEDIKSLEGQVDFKTGAECTGLLCFLQSFNFLLTAHIFKTVFDFIEPVSRALQAHNIDILMAIELIKKTENNIKGLRSSDVFFNIYESVKKIAKDNNFEFELTLLTRRVRRVPRQSGELSNDEQINDPVMAYKINTYFIIIDKVLSELNKRFNNNSIMIAKDLSL
ncbi:zinc finger MYM-type protein 1-like [Aphis gossypii]|uniref:zinc finger MYM-type protein 1-like n=1 Tax=Aphis gossypii TaxID=80765 RepID=UPI002158FC71|nr:zinc finger MYM-type protein 1-like [Aphis gossypii]